MALYEMTPGVLTAVASTTFAAEAILERADLQRALREHIEVLDPGLLVVAEEFGDFDVRRRIDLLCVDRTGHLVVVELKRTEEGGHMELQALRYAAMVSAMTFDQLAETYRRHLTAVDPARADEAGRLLADFLDDAGGPDTVLSRQVRIVLASAGFDPQITTTVLWLRDLYGLDITCVRLTPYRVAETLLLDVQHVIPLPEAAELTVQLRRRETAVRAAQITDGRDWTRYVITTPTGDSPPLAKRQAIRTLAAALNTAGVDPAAMADVLPGGRSRLLPVPGELGGDELETAFAAAHPGPASDLGRWFFDTPLIYHGQTWVLTKMWGRDTEPALDALLALSTTGAFGYHPA